MSQYKKTFLRYKEQLVLTFTSTATLITIKENVLTHYTTWGIWTRRISEMTAAGYYFWFAKFYLTLQCDVRRE